MGLDYLPAIELSLEKSVGRYFSISMAGAYQLYSFANEDSLSYVKPGGYKANLEVRFYFKTLSQKSTFARPEGLYVGVQPFFRSFNYNKSMNYFKASDTTRYYQDSFGVKNNCFGFNLIGGFQKTVKRFVVDVYWGAGIMQRTISNINLDYNPENGDEKAREHYITIQTFLGDLPEDSGIRLNLTAGAKLGFFLHRK